MRAIVDIETDAIDATVIHCIVARDYDNGTEWSWVGEECHEFVSWAKNVEQFIMHNGISFDAPVLNRLIGSTIQLRQIRDTLIESQLFNPVREGGHSLKAWGERLSDTKIEFKEFDYYTPEMLEYCKQDVRLTHKVAQWLDKEGVKFSTKSIRLENCVRAIVDQQEKNGFTLNLRGAMMLLSELQEEEEGLVATATEMFPPKELQLKTKIKYIPFNIASRKQIAERLMAKGWKPTKHTDKGNVIVNEETLSHIKMPEAQMFSRFFLLQKRTGMLKSWIKECHDDDKVRGRVMTLKTITGRMAHNSPNMAQVPASYSPYGKEFRSLWTISDPDNYNLVGTDASGLELRCLAHYMKDKEYIHEVVNGDVHTANMKMAGLTNRDQAKTFIYAFLYGAGADMIGKIVGGGAAQGRQLIESFLSNMPALKRLRTQVTDAATQGSIKGLDGRWLQIRSEHAALNTLLQGAGAIICKEWLVQMTKQINEMKLNAKLVGSIHDEYQFEVSIEDTPQFCEITKQAILDTEKILGVICPLDSEYKVGKTWAETH